MNSTAALLVDLNVQDKIEIAEGLTHLLAESNTLCQQTNNFHWTVTGPQFEELHIMFQHHYTELASAVDTIAKHIRMLDLAAPLTNKSTTPLGSIGGPEDAPSAADMVKILNVGHEQIIETCRRVLATAQDAGDKSTVALVSERKRMHEGTAWMLRSFA